MFKKLFGDIDLTWGKLVVFAAAVGIFTGITEWLPFTIPVNNFSFWIWILFCMIIITNSKSPVDSALKSSAFFLISQPLMYLVQVTHDLIDLPSMFTWWISYILLAALLGYFGHYVKNQNIWSILVLSPIFIFLTGAMLSSLSTAVCDPLRYSSLLSAIFDFVTVIIIILVILKKPWLRITAISLILTFATVFLAFFVGILPHKATINLSKCGIQTDKIDESFYTPYSDEPQDGIIKNENGEYELEVSGQRNSTSMSCIRKKEPSENSETEYYIRYHFDMIGNFSVDSVESVKL